MKRYRIIPKETAIKLAEALSKSPKWSQGKARTKELTGTVKQNEEILDEPCIKALVTRVKQHPDIALDVIPLKCYAKLSRTRNKGHYKMHTDSPWMGDVRTDVSCTLFLSDGYEGGELIVDGESVKGEPGEAVVYECGSPHQVVPVTSGERICLVGWFQSRVRDAAKRKIVGDMRRFLQKVEHDQDLFVEGGRIQSALLRRWSEI